jgi:uncharacterized protein YidB (DUF937 family)
MGLLDSVLGGVLGGGMAPGQRPGTTGGAGTALLMQIVAALLASRSAPGSGGGLGGLAGLAERFQRGGLGETMESWISTGPNQPVSPAQLGDVLGGDLLGELTQHTGMDRSDLLGQLSQLLPQMVDHATPEGRIPDEGLGDIGAILERFGGVPR